MVQGPHLLGRRGQQRCRGWARGWVPHKIQTNISLHVQPFEVFSVNRLKKKLGLRWADSPRNFVLKEEDLLTQAEKTPEHRVPPLHRGPLPCEWAGPLPVLWETRDR